MNRSMYFVYLHRRASDGLPFYVGKGTKYRERDKHNRSDWWKRVVEKHGYFIEILHQSLDEDTSKLLEVMEINNHRACGYPMVNRNNGGDGNHGWVPSDETKIKIGIGNSGKSPSSETRAKMSAAHTGRKHTEDSKEKIRLANLKRTKEQYLEYGRRGRSKEIHGFFNSNDGSFEICTQAELRDKFNLNASKVCDIIKGRRHHHMGFIHSKACCAEES